MADNDKVGTVEVIGELRRMRLWILVAVAASLVGLALAGALYVKLPHLLLNLPIFQPLSNGDEPPIRVKGGSLELKLITAQSLSKYWDVTTDEQGNNGWKVVAGSHKNEKLGLIIVSTRKDCGAFYHSKDQITFTFTVPKNEDPNQEPKTDEVWAITVNAKKKNSNVFVSALTTGASGFKLDVDGGELRRLYTDASGYVSSIQVDSDQPCSFLKGELEEAFLLEW
jgi:hypothetical protein